MRRPWPGLTLLFLLFSFVGCDSGGPKGSIEVTADFQDQLMGMRDTLSINLSSFFRSDSSSPIEWSATSSSSSAIARVDRTDLVVLPGDAGTATVTVTASGSGAAPVQNSFDVTVLCAIEPSPKESRYMPVANGTTWMYDYATSRYNTSDLDFPNSTRQWSGTLTWVISGYSESCDSAMLTITESFEGVYKIRDRGSGQVRSSRDTTWTESYDASFDGGTFVFEAYLDVVGGSFESIRPRTDGVVVALEFDAQSGSPPKHETYNALFKRDTGLIELSYTDMGTGHHFSTGMTLIQ